MVGEGRCPVINISGGTEVGACFLSPHVVAPLSACSLGGPALGMAVDVFDESGHPVRGEVGELVCTKPWPGMTRGLYKDPERYLDTYWSRWPNVWWHGDFASVSDDGQWFLHGRSDDTIKLAGKRLGPAEVETIVVAHPSVMEAAAIGIPDALKGEALWVFAVVGPGSTADDALRAEHLEARRRRARPVVQARGRSGSRPRCRRRAVRKCCGARSAPSSRATRPATCPDSRIPRPSTRSRRAWHDRARRITRVAAPAAARRLGGVARGESPRAATGSNAWEPIPEPGSADPALDYEAFRARCAAWERQRHFDAAYGFGLFLADGRFAGEVSLGSVQRGPFQMGYIGYWIDEACGGNEYMPEGVVLLIRYAFETLRMHRLEAAIVPRNAPSRRVAEKLGLRDEGTAQRFLQIQGVYEDHIRYAITLEEWRERAAELVARFVVALTPSLGRVSSSGSDRALRYRLSSTWRISGSSCEGSNIVVC